MRPARRIAPERLARPLGILTISCAVLGILYNTQSLAVGLNGGFEEVVRGSAAEVAARFAQPPKGEITLVIAPGRPVHAEGLDEAVRAVRELVGLGVPRRRAAEIIAPLAGVARNELYRRSL